MDEPPSTVPRSTTAARSTGFAYSTFHAPGAAFVNRVEEVGRRSQSPDDDGDVVREAEARAAFGAAVGSDRGVVADDAADEAVPGGFRVAVGAGAEEDAVVWADASVGRGRRRVVQDFSRTVAMRAST